MLELMLKTLYHIRLQKSNINFKKGKHRNSKNSQYISISDYCKANGLKPTKFYETLSRHPELAKKFKTNAKGERLLDEKAITAAGAILRKENRAKQGRSSASSAAVLPLK